MKALDILMDEHRVIEKVLNSLEIGANRLAAGENIPMDFFLKAADFIKNFADGCHHQKEEGILFVAMEANGMQRDEEPVSVMLEDHVEARRLTRAIREGAEQAAAQQVFQNARDYVALLREHIQKEDHALFPIAENAIPIGQHPRLLADFNRADSENNVREKYIRIAEELAKAAST
jgi:hemerythrin-like domain-containing protein